jgi:hypothetical protein
MPHPAIIKSTHKAIVAYYETLKAYGEHDVEHETALRSAFQNLLAETAKAHHWLLVPEQRTKVGGKTVIPDATLCDEYNLHRGYWEAKDTDDKLDIEIKKKIAKGYRLTSTIFEDTRQAVLFFPFSSPVSLDWPGCCLVSYPWPTERQNKENHDPYDPAFPGSRKEACGACRTKRANA